MSSNCSLHKFIFFLSMNATSSHPSFDELHILYFYKVPPFTFQDQHLLPVIRFNSYLLWALHPTFMSYTSFALTFYETHLLPVVRITSYFSWTLPPSFHRLHLPPIMGSYFHEFHLRPFMRSKSFFSWDSPPTFHEFHLFAFVHPLLHHETGAGAERHVGVTWNMKQIIWRRRALVD